VEFRDFLDYEWPLSEQLGLNQCSVGLLRSLSMRNVLAQLIYF